MTTVWVRRNSKARIVGHSIGQFPPLCGAWKAGEDQTDGDRPMAAGWSGIDDTATEYAEYQAIRASGDTSALDEA